jgi:Phosphoesterase family
MYRGELWAYEVTKAVLASPAWERTLLIYTYDEHGGYYDHVAPSAARAPDAIAPKLQPGDLPGGYDIRAAGAGDRRLPILAPQRRHQRAERSHLDPCHHRAQVEPAIAERPRRERGDGDGLPRRSAAAENAANAGEAVGQRSLGAGLSRLVSTAATLYA